MRKKIFLYYIILVVIGITITGFFISRLAQNLYKGEIEDNLKNIVALINSELSNKISDAQKIDYNQMAKNFSSAINLSHPTDTQSEDTDIRITFIDYSGKVLGESEADFNKMENHLTRKEIQEVLNGEIGEDIRHSKTLNIDFLYIAAKLKSSEVITRVSVPLVLLKKINEIIWYYTIIGIIVGLFLTTLLAFKFSSSLIRPINQLIALSKELSSGNYSKHLDITSKDEMGQLTDTFNKMSMKLQKTVADLIDKNVKFDTIMNSIINGIVAVDSNLRVILINAKAREMFNVSNDSDVIGINIIELIRNSQINVFIKESIDKNIPLVNEVSTNLPNDKIFKIYTNPIKSNDLAHFNSGGIVFIQDITDIKKLEQIRTDFVSNVTHELKTPLTSIRGFVETLRAGAIYDPNVSDKFLEIIDIEAERLYMLINDILQLSEIETNQKDYNISKYNLTPIVEEVLSILHVVADKKGVSLINNINGIITITANRDRLKQMLINLIDNSIKYNFDAGEVSITAHKTGGKVIISVKDSGIGIAPDHLPRIFERFYRVDKGRSRNAGGTGLGLSIVKHIVNLYSGDITVNSELGKGTEFVIKLPQ